MVFMPIVHFHDMFAKLEPGSFDGLPVPHREEEKRAVIRTISLPPGLKQERLPIPPPDQEI